MYVANQNFVFIHIGITMRFKKKIKLHKFFLHALKNKLSIDCAVFMKIMYFCFSNVTKSVRIRST